MLPYLTYPLAAITSPEPPGDTGPSFGVCIDTNQARAPPPLLCPLLSLSCPAFQIPSFSLVCPSHPSHSPHQASTRFPPNTPPHPNFRTSPSPHHPLATRLPHPNLPSISVRLAPAPPHSSLPPPSFSPSPHPLHYTRSLTAVKTRTEAVFLEALVEYRKMHARCVNGVKDWEAFFRDKDNGQHPNADVDGCKYLFWMAPGYAGLGNNLMSLISAMTYSLLTNRAIILAPGTDVASFLCNPFDDSNWAIPARHYKHVYLMFQKQPRVMEFARMAANGTQWSKKAAFADLRFSYGEEDWKFFCPGVQAAIEEARFVAFYTDEYTVPGFYLLPHLQALLQKWFPDGRVFLHMARATLQPANYLWQRITRVFHAHLKHHNRRVGIQVRTFYRRDTDTNPRILECAVNVSGYLPRLFSPDQWDALTANPDSRMQAILRNPYPRTVGVLLTSLSQHHMDYLHEAFSTHETVDGTVVALHSEGHEGLERAKLRQHEKAFLEMWLLSFSDQLLVSDMSSFGYIASGLSGLNPYSLNIGFRTAENLNWYINRRPVCARSSSEPCFLTPPAFLKCDGSEVKKEPLELSTRIRKCLNINRGIEVDIPLF
ncbi:unnamed protein product [Closterium sp. NIES-65]|nr:unnamed protein product [Closterium sp. NIES-65]